MAGAGKWLWAIPLTMAVPAPALAQAAEPCGALQRIIAASREATPFRSIREALARGESMVPGFAAEYCRVDESRGLFCHRGTRPATDFGAWPDPLVCPGLDLVSAPPPRRRAIGGDWMRAYRSDGLIITYGVDCTICAGPAFLGFSARFERTEEEAR